MVQDLYALMFTMFGVNWVLPGSVRETLKVWQGSFVKKKLKKLWMAIPFCLFWIIWRERNKAVLENVVPLVQRMKNHFVYTLWMSIV